MNLPQSLVMNIALIRNNLINILRLLQYKVQEKKLFRRNSVIRIPVIENILYVD